MASTSFNKKVKANIRQIPGVKPSIYNNQLLISTGIPSLDTVLGGGVAVGTVLLIEEDVGAKYAEVMTRYFLAEGVVSHHALSVVSADEDPQKMLERLPAPVKDAAGVAAAHGCDKQQPPPEGAGDAEGKMAIAWRYQRQPKVQQPVAQSQLGHYYNLSQVMDKERLHAADVDCVDFSHLLAYENEHLDTMLHDVRHKHFTAESMKILFRDIPPDVILEFLREINIFHLILDTMLHDVRHKHFTAESMKILFRDIPPDVILEFLREINIFHLILDTMLHDVRHKHFTAESMKILFRDVPPDVILEFLREINIFHLILDTMLHDVRHKHFTAESMKILFRDVPPDVILEFLREINIFHLILDTMQTPYCRYHCVLQRIRKRIEEGKFATSAKCEKRNILRIAIHGLGSTLWGDTGGADDDEDASLLQFLLALRALLRTAFSVSLLTIPSYLFQSAALVKRAQRLCDTVLRLHSFSAALKTKNPAFRDYSGLLHLVKFPCLNELVPHMPDTLDLAFRCRRKKFTIEKLHLPPELSDTANREQDEAQVPIPPSLACSTGGSSRLDF